MKDLQRLAKRAMEELDVIGVPYANVETFSVNTRARSRWGQTRKSKGKYYIEISDLLLDDVVADESALDTLIHELLHTCPNCMNHGQKWQEWAELVNDCYACYHISRCSSAQEKGIIAMPEQMGYKWVIRCECGQEWKYKRKPTRFTLDEHNTLKHCSCPYCKGTELRLERW